MLRNFTSFYLVFNNIYLPAVDHQWLVFCLLVSFSYETQIRCMVKWHVNVDSPRTEYCLLTTIYTFSNSVLYCIQILTVTTYSVALQYTRFQLTVLQYTQVQLTVLYCNTHGCNLQFEYKILYFFFTDSCCFRQMLFLLRQVDQYLLENVSPIKFKRYPIPLGTLMWSMVVTLSVGSWSHDVLSQGRCLLWHICCAASDSFVDTFFGFNLPQTNVTYEK